MKIECLILLIGIKGIDNQSIALAKNLGFEFKKIKIEINPFLGTFPFFGQIFNNLGRNTEALFGTNFISFVTLQVVFDELLTSNFIDLLYVVVSFW